MFALITAYRFGNARELENAVERATVLASKTRIDVDDFPQEVGLAVPDAFSASEARPLAEVERDYIMAVLRASGGNRTKAAATLGIGAATLYRKLKEYENLRVSGKSGLNASTSEA